MADYGTASSQVKPRSTGTNAFVVTTFYLDRGMTSLSEFRWRLL